MGLEHSKLLPTGTIATAALAVIPLIAIFIVRTRRSLDRREAFSCAPLGVAARDGIRKFRKVENHSILALQDIKNLDEYIKMTGSRTVKTTMSHQIDVCTYPPPNPMFYKLPPLSIFPHASTHQKAFEKHALIVTTVGMQDVSWPHLAVPFSFTRA